MVQVHLGPPLKQCRAQLRRPAFAVGAIGAAIAMLASAITPNALADPNRRIAPPTLTWRSCHERFECARVEVPLDYADLGGRSIELALIKLPATEAANPRTLFVNPGGPGDSGVKFVLNAGRATFAASVRAEFDIIGFDPRGVGRSTPLQCFASYADQLRAFRGVPAFPVTRAQERVTERANAKLAGACAKRRPALAAHLTTGEVARDLNLLRRAVGDPKLTFVGYSYGTYVASVYANIYPDKVRAVVADGVIDPVSWLGVGDRARQIPVDVRLKSDEGAESTLRAFLHACDDYSTRCAFSGGSPERAVAKYDTLMHRNQRHDIHLPGRGWYSFADSVNAIRWQFYDYRRWDNIAVFLQRLWRHSDDRAESSTAEDPQPSVTAVTEKRPGRVGGYYNGYDLGAAVTCGDTHNPKGASAWRRWADRRATVAPTFGRWWTWLDEVCAPWSLPSPGRYEGPFNNITSNPLLVVGNVNDPATRYQDAVDMARRQPGAQLLTIKGSGHTSLGVNSPCAQRVITRYLLHPDVELARSSCRTVGRPFR